MIDWATIGRREIHPTKRAILELLDKDKDGVLSPKQMAETLDLALAGVSYHVTCLVNAGYIELVRTEPRRGAVEHFYKLVRP